MDDRERAESLYGPTSSSNNSGAAGADDPSVHTDHGVIRQAVKSSWMAREKIIVVGHGCDGPLQNHPRLTEEQLL